MWGPVRRPFLLRSQALRRTRIVWQEGVKKSPKPQIRARGRNELRPYLTERGVLGGYRGVVHYDRLSGAAIFSHFQFPLLLSNGAETA